MSVHELVAARGHAHERQVGEVYAAWRVASNTLMLLGWQGEPPPLEGMATLQRAGGQRGRFTRFAWPVGSDGKLIYRFVTAVQLPGAEMRGGDALLLTGRRGADDSLVAQLPPAFLDPLAFGAELSRATPAGAATSVAEFLIGLFTRSATTSNRDIRSMLLRFLETAAEPDGCIELRGSLRDHRVVLRGWGRGTATPCDAILVGTGLQRHSVDTAEYGRPDIARPDSGQIVLLPAIAAQDGIPEALFFLTPQGIRRRPVLPECRSLTENETIAHVRDMLPTLRCDVSTRAALIKSIRPKYEGRFTLYDGGHPVRLSIDVTSGTPDAGAYLSGWLYDPAGIVESVHFCRSRGTPERLDQRWTRIPRPDVTEAYRNDTTMPAADPHNPWHGFAVHAPGGDAEPADGPCYLEVLLCDGWCGFVPIALAPVKGESGRARLVAGVDLHKPSGLSVIERQLAPFFAAMPAPHPTFGRDEPSFPAEWSYLIVVPLQAVELPRALLSAFLGDPLAPHEGVVFVCSQEWAKADLAALENLARFYGISPVVTCLAGAATPRDALVLAATHSGAAHVLLLGPGTVGGGPGWRRTLEAMASRDAAAACLSPTVLYEDNSIRFAGCDAMTRLDAEPYVRLRRALAGLPASFAPAGPERPVAGISAACCVLPRAALDKMKMPRGSVATVWEPELELAMHLRLAGIPCRWAPSVQVFAPEDPVTSDPSSRANRLLAGWCLRAQLDAEEG